jgi:transglutaminase-like putative cysteine protease
MSALTDSARAGARLHPGAAPRGSAAAAAQQERPWLRLAAFAALAAYGLERWATLLQPAPGWRLVGLLALAVALAGGVPLLARRDRVVSALVGFFLLLAAFPMAGLRWQWFVHMRVQVSAEAIGTGLQTLPNTLVPYVGHSSDVRLVIVLGAAVLLLDAAAVLGLTGWGGGPMTDARRAAAALPLTALAIVPSTLLRPQWPYVQGLLLFVLLAVFLWGERVRRQSTGSALLAVTAAGVLAAIVAPHIDQRAPWIDYRSWAGSLVHRRVDAFDWNQTYGPLRWPRSGHEVLTVRARTGDYWKAENLDAFTGYGWAQSAPGEVVGQSPGLPNPESTALDRWTQTIQVSIAGMQTDNVIAAGYAGQPSGIPGLALGTDPGTWTSDSRLGPGATYRVTTYSPRPSAHQLATAGGQYPSLLLTNYLMLMVPATGLPGAVMPERPPQVQFPLFGTRGTPVSYIPGPVPNATGIIRRSPYAAAYALARRLAAGAATPYAFVAAVERYLAHGFTYNENPPLTRYPLATFLFSNHRGYCQQFSGAMALLLRMGGVPARVAAGFTSGTYESSTHEWVVTDRDAHAWVEVWFPKYGWVRFDPTPASAPARSDSTSAAITKPVGPVSGVTSAEAPRRDIGGQLGTTSAAHHHSGGAFAWWLVLIGVLAAAALGVLVWWTLSAPRVAERLVDELERALARTRRPLTGGTTLAGLEHRMHASPGAEAYVRALRLARYGGRAQVPTGAERRAVRRELARGLGTSGRLRAWWALPPWLRRPRAAADGPDADSGPAPRRPGRS